MSSHYDALVGRRIFLFLSILGLSEHPEGSQASLPDNRKILEKKRNEFLSLLVYSFPLLSDRESDRSRQDFLLVNQRAWVFI